MNDADSTTGSSPNEHNAVSPERAARRAEDARLVAALRAGDTDAYGRLYDDWFDRVFDVARRIVRDDDAAADVAQDAFLRAWRGIDTLADPASFGGWLLRITRNAALNHRRKHERATAVPDETIAMIELSGPSASDAPSGFRIEDSLGSARDPAIVAERHEASALLLGAADALGERDADVLNLHLRHGLSPAEIGEVVGVNRNAANQLVHRLKQRLGDAVRARVLWRDGQPRCDVLRAELASTATTTFDADAVKMIERHADGCDQCSERRRLRVEPAALFSAVPIAAAPALLKADVAHALAASGVPMSGSASIAAEPASESADSASTEEDDLDPGSHEDDQRDDTTDLGEPEPPSSVRRALLVLGAVVASLTLAALAVGILADRAGDGSGTALETEVTNRPATTQRSVRTSTTTAASTTTTVDPTTTASSAEVFAAVPPDPPPATAPPPTQPPPVTTVPATTAPPPTTSTTTTTTTTTAAPRSGRISIRPSQVPEVFEEGAGPVLLWTTTQGTSARVLDPEGILLSEQLSGGGLEVCPGTWDDALCFSIPGTYLYSLEVDGDVVADAALVVVVG